MGGTVGVATNVIQVDSILLNPSGALDMRSAGAHYVYQYAKEIQIIVVCHSSIVMEIILVIYGSVSMI